MVNLSQEDRTIILEHHLDHSLDHLQDALRKAEQSYKPGVISYDGAVGSDQGLQKATSRLLYALQGSDVALTLHSKTGKGDLASELSTLFRHVRNGSFVYEHYRALFSR